LCSGNANKKGEVRRITRFVQACSEPKFSRTVCTLFVYDAYRGEKRGERKEERRRGHTTLATSREERGLLDDTR